MTANDNDNNAAATRHPAASPASRTFRPATI